MGGSRSEELGREVARDAICGMRDAMRYEICAMLTTSGIGHVTAVGSNRVHATSGSHTTSG
eukprot:358696-Chlamydomonas_euryale.AAC.4